MQRTLLNCRRLEERACPATLVNPTTLTYQDIDGDNVAVVFSKPLLTAANVDTLFTFNTGPLPGNGDKQQLFRIDVTSLGASATGVNITTTATRSTTNGGDGFMALGVVDATGVDLGAVKIDGDLVKLNAGDADATTRGLKGLTVDSLGRGFLSTGAVFPDLHTVVVGRIDTLSIKRDLFASDIDVQGGVSGQIGTLTIGGSLIAVNADNSARIRASGSVGTVTISGNFEGERNVDTARLVVGGRLGSLTVGGSLIGASAEGSGSIAVGLGIGTAMIRGSLVGGAGDRSGALGCDGRIDNLKVLGSLFGGGGFLSGALASESYSTVAVTGSVVGGRGTNAGSVSTFNNAGSISVGGSLIGGAGKFSGAVGSGAGRVGKVTIGGDVVGGKATGTDDLSQSGVISAKSLGTVTLGGSLIAGTDETSGVFQFNGAIIAQNDIGSLTVKGNLSGNFNNFALVVARGQESPTGTIDLAIGKLAVKGRVDFALILAGYEHVDLLPVNADAQIGSITVGGSWSASSVSAGVFPTNANFGDVDDAKIAGASVKDDANVSSRIGSFKVGGTVFGTGVDIGDHYGIVAESVGVVSVAGVLIPTQAGLSNDEITLGITADFSVNEV